MDKILFLDLEQTLIESWYVPDFCNRDFINKIIDQEGTNKIHLFSFAIIEESDQLEFQKRFKNPIENHFNIEILSVISVREMMNTIFKSQGAIFEKFEFITIWGKLKAFQDYCAISFENTECVLVDDIVPNTTYTLTDKNLIIRTIKAPVLG